MLMVKFQSLKIGQRVFYRVGENTLEGTITHGQGIEWDDGDTQYPAFEDEVKYIWPMEG